MGMKPNLLPETDLTDASVRAQTAAATGVDLMTSLHMRNWLECMRSGKTPNAPVEAGYYHSVSTIMTTAALHTGKAVTFDPKAPGGVGRGRGVRILNSDIGYLISELKSCMAHSSQREVASVISRCP